MQKRVNKADGMARPARLSDEVGPPLGRAPTTQKATGGLLHLNCWYKPYG